MGNKYLVGDPDFVYFLADILKEPTQNWQNNLSKCFNTWYCEWSLCDIVKLCRKLKLSGVEIQKLINGKLSRARIGVSSFKAERKSEKRQMEKLEKQKQKLEQENALLRNNLAQNQVQYDAACLKLRRLRDVAIQGKLSVQYHNIDIVKPNIGSDYGMRTPKFNQYKKLLNQLTKRDDKKWRIDFQANIYNIDAKLVATFLDDNGESNMEPMLSINDEKIANNEVVGKYTIKNCQRIPGLNGQVGVCTKMDIPKHTIVGQFVGLEFSSKEYHLHIGGSAEETLHNLYALDLGFDDKV